LSWFLVEQPFLRWKERLDNDPREVAAPTPVTGSPTVDAASRWRRQLPLGAAGIVTLAIVVGIAALSVETTHATSPRHYAVTNEVVTVPHLVGKDVFAAAAALNGAHLNPNTMSQPSARVRAGRVSAQTPAAGSRVHRGTTVTVVFSSGPADTG
jgi:hypothetical protein